MADAEDFLREDTAKEEFAGSEETTQFFRKVYCFSICYTRKLYTEEDQNSTVFRKYEVGGTISGRIIYDYIMNLKDDKGRPRRAERGKTAIIDYAAARKSPLNISIDLITQTQRREEKQPYFNAVQVVPPQYTDEEKHFAVQHWKLHILLGIPLRATP